MKNKMTKQEIKILTEQFEIMKEDILRTIEKRTQELLELIKFIHE